MKRVIKENPSILIIGNSHGYNKSIPELYDLYKLNVPQLYMDYYSMWGPYFTDRYKEVIGINPFKRNILSLGSLRHDFLFKNFKWDRGKTNGKVLMIHEPVSSEGWNDISPEPIGDNRVSESMIEELDRNNIPFDFKVHPNWTDFISNTGDQMWKPHSRVNVVNIPITEMIKYEAVIASWSSIQFEALTMGMPVINVEYKYPTVNDSEWGPGRHGLLKAIKPEDIPHALETVGKSGSVVDMKLLEYFLKRQGRALTRDDILNAVWGYNSFVTDRSVDRFVTTLRNKIEKNPQNPVFIHTIREIGYKFEFDS